MTAREQYKYAQRVMRLANNPKRISWMFHEIYLSRIENLRTDILMAAWQTL